MKKEFIVLILYLLIGFILVGNETSMLWYGRRLTMIGGIIDGFILPARWLSAIFVDEIAWLPRGFQTTHHKLGMILGIILFLGLIYRLIKK